MFGHLILQIIHGLKKLPILEMEFGEELVLVEMIVVMRDSEGIT